MSGISKNEDKNKKIVTKKETTDESGSSKSVPSTSKNVKWITVHGLHIPLGVGEAEEDVIKRMIEKRELERIKEKKEKQNAVDKQYEQIEKNQEQKDALNEDTNSVWAKAPLINKDGEYTKQDLQRILNYFKKNTAFRDKFISSLPKTSQGRTLSSIIKSGSVGSFDANDKEIITKFSEIYKNYKH